MATEVAMPQMGYDMTEGTVVKWVKQEGDEVLRGETIAEIETDKATIEMEASASGTLLRILIAEGETVPVGQIIGFIGASGEALPEEQRPIEQIEKGKPSPLSDTAKESTVTNEDIVLQTTSEAYKPEGSPIASPVARRVADELGIDIREVSGTGPRGRIVKEDVLAYNSSASSTQKEEQSPSKTADAILTDTASAPSQPGEVNRIELSKMGQAIARRTQQANRDIPAYYVSVTIDMTKAMEFRRELNSSVGDTAHVSVNDLIVKACAIAIEKMPKFNAIFKDSHLEVPSSINIGLAIALPEGLIVPAILGCESKSLLQIAKETKDLGERARASKLRQDEYTLGTFSISNLGMYNINSFTAIIHEPGTAVAAIGAVLPQVVAQDGEALIREMMQITLSADHRASNGADGAAFMMDVKRLLETPLLLLNPH